MKKLVIFLALIAFLSAPLTALADKVKVRAKVDGLSCPFCAYGIEKKIKKLEGVEEVSVDVKSGTVTVIYKDKKFFDNKRLNQALKDAGFTPGAINLMDEAR